MIEQLQLLRAVLQTTVDGFWTVDSGGMIVDVNEAYCRMSGYGREELLGMHLGDIDAIDRPEESEKRMRRIAANRSEIFETRHRRKDGSLFDVEVSMTFLDEEGGTFVGFCRDVTEYRRAVEELQRSQAFLSAVYEHSEIGVYVVDVPEDGDFVYEGINPAHERLIGVEASKIVGKSPDDLVELIGREAVEYVKSLYRECIRKRKTVESENYIPEGPMMGWWYYTLTPQFAPSNGRVEKLIGSRIRITELKQTQMALQDERKRLGSIIEGTGFGTWEWNVQTGETIFNERWAQMLGYSLEELSPVNIETWEKLTHPDDLANAQINLERHFSGELPLYNVETRMRHKDGRWIWIHDLGKVLSRTESGEPLMTFGIHSDITEQKRTEEMQRESAMRYRALAELSPDAILVNHKGRFVYANPAALLLFGATGPQDLIGRSPFDLIEPEYHQVARERIARTLANNASNPPLRQRWRRFDGTIAEVEVTAGAIEWSGNPAVQVLLRDISERVKAEEHIRTLLAEKELLLKEVHHRIKNNMNTMRSLLSVQASTAKHPEASAALRDAEQRMLSMSLLYDQLYRSENIRSMSARDFLPPLVQQIVGLFPGKTQVEVVSNVEDFKLDVKSISSLGIIMTELVTNAMKYAFTGRESGTITVSASRQDDRAIIRFGDDGVGMPGSVELGSSAGLGLTMISMVTDQIDGTITLERSPGTTFILEFPFAEQGISTRRNPL